MDDVSYIFHDWDYIGNPTETIESPRVDKSDVENSWLYYSFVNSGEMHSTIKRLMAWKSTRLFNRSKLETRKKMKTSVQSSESVVAIKFRVERSFSSLVGVRSSGIQYKTDR